MLVPDDRTRIDSLNFKDMSWGRGVETVQGVCRMYVAGGDSVKLKGEKS